MHDDGPLLLLVFFVLIFVVGWLLKEAVLTIIDKWPR